MLNLETQTVRTNLDIISDLFKYLVEDAQWSGKTNIACGCHPEWVKSCASCPAFENGANEHNKNCELKALIEEVRALLRIENKLMEESDDIDPHYYNEFDGC